MKIKRSTSEIAFNACNYLFLTIVCLTIIIPLLHLWASSLSTTYAWQHSQVKLWPVGWNFDNYTLVFRNNIFWRAFGVTLFVVVVGTTINMILTILTAYPLSKPDLRGRKSIMLFIIFTMIFQAPIIPTYLVVKNLGMLNTVWALIIPIALSAFNLLLCITFFRSLPEEMFDAAKVDGLSDYKIVWRIVVPLSMPINVTLLLFYAVGHWNNYFTPMLYITDKSLRTLQLYLYSLIAQATSPNEGLVGVPETLSDFSPQGIQMSTVIVATIPILLVYPFIQKHFIKGALLGSLKE